MYYEETTGKLLNYLIKHHQQKGIKSQIQTWWKSYWELEKELGTVSFWLRKDVVIFLSGSTYRQQPRHLLTRMGFSDMLKTLKSFITWKIHKSHWLENCCKRDKMKNVSDWNRTAVHFEWGKRDLEETEHGKRSWGIFLATVFINDKENKHGSSIFVSISKSIWQVSIGEMNG